MLIWLGLEGYVVGKPIGEGGAMAEIKANQSVTFEFPDMHPDIRLRELILYVASKCSSDPEFNATRLNKILFYSDFVSYARTGKPITGAAYQALPHGPAPKRLKPISHRLIAEGEWEHRK